MLPDVITRPLARRLGSVLLVLGIVVLGLLLVLAPRQVWRAMTGVGAWMDRRGAAEMCLAAGGREGAYYRLGTLLQEELGEKGIYHLDVLETAGSLDNLKRIQEGRADFGLVQGGLESGLPGLHAVASVGLQYAHVIAPADSSITTFRDLAGKRVGVGPASGGSAVLAKQVFDFFDFAEPVLLVPGHAPALAEAFSSGDIEAAFVVYRLFAPAVESLLDTGYYRLLPIPEALGVAHYLPGVSAETFPLALYGPGRSLPEAQTLPTLAVDTLLVAREDTPDHQVEALLHALYDEGFKTRARLDELTEARGRSGVRLPLHPAAEVFYARHAPVSSDRFEIGSFFLAGLVCVASTMHFLLGKRQQRRVKRRREAIRPFFEKMLEYGAAVANATDKDELVLLLDEMMAVQRQAERSWLEGELDTEHMENLYAVYNIRSRNAFSKILQFQLGDAPLPAPRGASDLVPRPDEPASKAETAPCEAPSVRVVQKRSGVPSPAERRQPEAPDTENPPASAPRHVPAPGPKNDPDQLSLF